MKLTDEQKDQIAFLEHRYLEEIEPYIEVKLGVKRLSIPAYIVTDDRTEMVEQLTDAQREVLAYCDENIRAIGKRYTLEAERVMGKPLWFRADNIFGVKY